MSFRRTMLVTVGIALLASCAYAAQQQDQPSVAEAARKNREEKTNQPKPTKVYNDDNIGGAGGPDLRGGPDSPRASDSNGTGHRRPEPAHTTRPIGTRNLPPPERNLPTTRRISTSFSANTT